MLARTLVALLLAAPIAPAWATPPQAAGPAPVAAARPDSWDTPRAVEVRVDSAGRRFVAGEVLVAARSPADVGPLVDAARGLGAEWIGEIPRLTLLKLALPPQADEEAFAAVLAARPDVRYAELDWLGQDGAGAGGAPDDTHYGEQWHLANTGQSGGTADADIDADGAWAIEAGHPSVVLAVLDSGIDFLHPEFAGRTLGGFDFVGEDADPTADHPHGVWVTGLAAANADNAFQVAGVDRACTILPVKVLDRFNAGTTFDLAQGLDYCAQEAVEVVNMSLINYPLSATLQDALAAARAASCILVACAGNGGVGDADDSAPGVSPLTISIGATDHDDERAGFSGTGNALDFVAPGSSVYTVDLGGADAFDSFTGCSAATPVASGIVCLLVAQDPSITQECVYDALRVGAEDAVGDPAEDAPGWDPFMGHGRLNARASLLVRASCDSPSFLTGAPASIDLETGGSQVLSLEADSSFAGSTYVVLGSLAGTRPGFPVDGLEVPLVADVYFLYSLTHPNTAVQSSVGLLDGDGTATATFALPPASSPALGGLEIQHAYVVLGTGLDSVVAVSNAYPVEVFQKVALLDEDFESGAPGWTFDNAAGGLWHLAGAGDCGLGSAAAAYDSGPADCDYVPTGAGHSGSLASPDVALGEAPFELRFESTLDLAPGDLAFVNVFLDEAGGSTLGLATTNDFDTSGSTESFTLPLPASLAGSTVRVRFSFSLLFGTGDAGGWQVDDVRLLAKE